MSEDSETAIQRALDAADRGRRWAFVGVGTLFLATVIALAALLGALVRPGVSATVTFKTLYVATIVETLFTACCTVIVMLHITRMAKAILRQLE